MARAITQTLDLPSSGVSNEKLLKAFELAADYTGTDPDNEWLNYNRIDKRTKTWFFPQVSMNDGLKSAIIIVRIKVKVANAWLDGRSDAWHEFVVTDGKFSEPLPLVPAQPYKSLKLVSNWSDKLSEGLVVILAKEAKWFTNRVRDSLRRV